MSKKKVVKKAAKKVTSKEVSTGKMFTQDDIPKALEQVKAQIAELNGGDDTKSSAAKKDFPGIGLISDVNDVSDLIKIHSTLAAKENAYNDSVATLNLVIKVPAFEIEGCSASDWEKVIKSQITKVVHKKKIESLKKIQTILEARQTEEQKIRTSMEQISDLMAEANEF